MRYGVDWAWGSLSPATLRSVGASFAARYLSYDSGKNLSPSEARWLSQAGIDLVVVWETTAARALSGYNAGVEDARAALAQARACGKPDWAPIYFAVDIDESPGEASVVESYFRGVNAVLGVARTGVYGGFWTVKRLFEAGVIKYGWQTIAWSGGMWYPRSQLRQVGVDHVLAGVGDDPDLAVAADFGQWRVGQRQAAPPPPPPYWYCMWDERFWVERWNQLRSDKSLHAHWQRVKLKELMTTRRKTIWYRAQKSGWKVLHRDLRYALLREYTSKVGTVPHAPVR